MLISPPFLPPRPNNATDDDWLDIAMPADQQGHGKYPLSFNLGWHGGIHLQAPQGEDGHPLSVRAIADGTVVYVRQPEPPNDNHEHPLNYGDVNGNPVWTSSGCVVIRHTTEIGSDLAGQATTVTFFSVYMHLHTIRPTAQRNRPIYRKDEIGEAGYIYGQPNLLHFEIICDDANLQRLAGRITGDLSTAQNGRTDAIFGCMHFHLPAGTAVYAQQPAANVVRPAIQPAHTTSEELYVTLRYAEGDGAAGNRGDAYLQTCRADGTAIGGTLEENDAEYNLYTEANRIVAAYRNANAPQVPCASAVYELLRFGRIIGPDALTPADTPHWRQVRYDGVQGWVNLNAANVRKFSDADFPHWMGWKLVDDSADQDSRCDSAFIRSLLDADNNGRVPPQEAAVRLQESIIQDKLARIIAKFPTEWDASSIENRWGWLKTSTAENTEPLTNEDFGRLKAHLEALCFWQEANIGVSASHWHFHPKVFIKHFRKCGWLSTNEMAQCIPRRNRHLHGNHFTVQQVATWSVAAQRSNTWSLPLNFSLRKHQISSSAQRLAHFFAQVLEESGYFRLVKESGGELRPYAPYYGRGLIQLTHVNNYQVYGHYRNFTQINPSSAPPFQAAGWNPDQLLATDNQNFNPRNCADSAAFYWTCPLIIATGINALRTSDIGIDTATIIAVSRATNGNVPQQNINGLATRIQAFIYLKYVLLDVPRIHSTEQVQFGWRQNAALEPLFHPNGQPVLKPNGQQRYGYVLGNHTVDVPLEHQKP